MNKGFSWVRWKAETEFTWVYLQKSKIKLFNLIPGRLFWVISRQGGFLAHNTKIFIKSLLFTIKSWNLVQLIFELYFLFYDRLFVKKWWHQHFLIVHQFQYMKMLFLVVELILKVFIWFYMFSFINVPARQV